jgi:hypothetical protein
MRTKARIRCHEIYTKSHKDWLTHSRISRTDTHTGRKDSSYIYSYFYNQRSCGKTGTRKQLGRSVRRWVKNNTTGPREIG